MGGRVDFRAKDFLEATRMRQALRGALPIGAFSTTGTKMTVQALLMEKAQQLLGAYGKTEESVAETAVASAVNLTMDHYRSVLEYSARILADAQHNLTKLT